MFIFKGEEIGMLDYRDITWEDTVDPQACNTNNPSPDVYKGYSRDPQRTPFKMNTIYYNDILENKL